MWFKNKRSEGIIYPDLFNPISVPSIALILTAVSSSMNYYSVSTNLSTPQIECNIDEWISGTKTDVTFWADDYRALYDSHFLSLTSFGQYSESKGVDLLGWLQRRLYNFGRLVFFFFWEKKMGKLNSFKPVYMQVSLWLRVRSVQPFQNQPLSMQLRIIWQTMSRMMKDLVMRHSSRFKNPFIHRLNSDI